MDEVLINNWNNKVTNKDTVYILGDFCFRSGKDPEYYLKTLDEIHEYYVDLLWHELNYMIKEKKRFDKYGKRSEL